MFVLYRAYFRFRFFLFHRLILFQRDHAFFWRRPGTRRILKPTERHHAVAQRQASVAMSVIFSLDDTIRASVYVTASLSMLCG